MDPFAGRHRRLRQGQRPGSRRHALRGRHQGLVLRSEGKIGHAEDNGSHRCAGLAGRRGRRSRPARGPCRTWRLASEGFGHRHQPGRRRHDAWFAGTIQRDLSPSDDAQDRHPDDPGRAPITVTAPSAPAARTVSAPLPRLAPGNYAAAWTAEGPDGHRMNGSTRFMVH
ncbi:copper resistance CopC family protein [Brevundimonas diminuta]|uniref:copper resistance CopC family protein n=1 Tax=Brevundimonas diminuta TaxID=293 RepID=UPI003D9A524B